MRKIQISKREPFPLKREKGEAVIKNIGTLVTGDVENPIRKESRILVKDGLIKKIGTEREIGEDEASIVIDANGMTVLPGLIEAHAHITFHDYSAINQSINWMENLAYCGITTLISEGAHAWGLGRYYDDPVATKANAITEATIYKRWMPGSALKVLGGALILVHGLTEEDFKEMSEAGVKLIAEIGGGGVAEPSEAKPLVKHARKYKMHVSVHASPPSIPGSTAMDSKAVLALDPDKVAHLNGGSTPLPWEEIKRIIDGTRRDTVLEVSATGNTRLGLKIVEYAKEKDQLDRVVFGSDQAIGLGLTWGSLWVLIGQVASMTDVPAEKVIAMATGNTAEHFSRFVDMNRGIIEEGREADIVISDKAAGGVGKNMLEAMKHGDACAPGMVMVDGRVVSIKGRDYQFIERAVKINGDLKDLSQAPENVEEYLFGSPPPRYHKWIL